MPFVALAGIGVIGEALIALGILAAVVLIGYLVEKFGSYIPVIGGWLASKARDFLSWSVSQLSGTFNGALWALSNLVSIVVVVFTFPFANIQRFTSATAGAFWWLKYAALPNVLNIALTAVNQALWSAYAYTQQVRDTIYGVINSTQWTIYAWAQTQLSNVLSQAYAWAQAGYSYTLTMFYNSIAYIQQAIAPIEALVKTVLAIEAWDIADVRHYVDATESLIVGQIEHDLTALEHRLVALIESYVAAAEKDVLWAVDLIGVGSLTSVWPEIVSDVDGILGEIPQELIDIREQLARIPRAIPAGLLGALAALGALAVPLLRYLKDCGVPMCRDLHGLSDLLGALTEGATDAALLAMVVSAVHDPKGTANEMDAVFGPVARDAVDLVKNMIGV